MTAIRDRQSDPDADDVPVPWDERPVVGSRRGLPWWAAVLVGLGLAIVGAFLGKPNQNNIPLVFTVCYIAGAVIAVCAVKRRGLFGPMVMPPLVLAVTVPGVILLTSGSAGDDMLSKALSIGTPLINGFPTMAITTGITLLIGFVRIFRERDPDAPKKGKKDDARPRPAGSNRTGQTPLPAGAKRGRDGEPPRRPRPPADGERRPPRAAAPAERDPGSRGTRKPPPPAARRTPRPENGDPRPPRGDAAPRRRPRPPEDGRDNPPPRRPPGGRGAPPRRNRPWDDEER
ncbi:DUF6542 domain-containing protein [Amycolatopsis sp. MtRt-6]|uniref:DUF6542 domain-containing protein n=1 Tax=Amycolatopsis sp. MtRt-6 TaxID=2792782 RepID=UPI001A8F9318|nr:DUF6542 domain-containing protein [Amycolatopsis sp. MtRt-6]